MLGLINQVVSIPTPTFHKFLYLKTVRYEQAFVLCFNSCAFIL